MLSFKERKALLNKALSKHTAESLYKKLTSYEAIGPTVVGHELKSDVAPVSMKLRNLSYTFARNFEADLDFGEDSSQLDKAA